MSGDEGDGAKDIKITTTKIYKSAQIVCITFVMPHVEMMHHHTHHSINFYSICEVKRNARLFLAMIDFLLRLLLLHFSRANSKVACCQFACYCCASSIFILISSNTSHTHTHNRYCLVTAFTFKRAGRQAGIFGYVRYDWLIRKCNWRVVFLHCFCFGRKMFRFFVIMDATNWLHR